MPTLSNLIANFAVYVLFLLKGMEVIQTAMGKCLLHIMLACVAFMCGGCNSDIFVEPAPDIVESVSIPGYNGRAIVKIRKKGLVGISFGNSFCWDTGLYGFDSSGNEIYNPSYSDGIVKYLYYCHDFAVECSLDGDDMEIVVLDNACAIPRKIWINLDYGHTVRSVDVEMGVGKRLEIYDLGHDLNNFATSFSTRWGWRSFLHNNTDRTLTMTVFPYKDAKSQLYLESDDDSYWSYGAAGEVFVPYYRDGEWSLSYGEMIGAKIGDYTSFVSSAMDTEEGAEVEVPPHSSVMVDVSIKYAVLSSEYVSQVRLPNTNLTWLVRGKYELRQPIGYTLDTKPLEL